jgi:hypothetical protein
VKIPPDCPSGLGVIALPKTYGSGSPPIDQSGGREIRVEDDGVFR